MKKERLVKMQAAYLAGCLSKDVMESYFPFVAYVIAESHIVDIHVQEVASKFEGRYGFSLPLTVIREILSVGVRRGVFKYDAGKGRYWVANDLTSQFFDDKSFNLSWQLLCEMFSKFCLSRQFVLNADYQEYLLNIIEEVDECCDGDAPERQDSQKTDYCERFRFLWHSFVLEQDKLKSKVSGFINSLGLAGVVKDMVFFSGDARSKFSGLKVYLDTPIVFAVLGMDERPRVDMCRYLLQSLKECGCSVLIFDHCLHELERVIRAADRWVHSSEYSSAKASPAGRYLFEQRWSHEQIVAFVETIEAKLKEFRIDVDETTYNVDEIAFQIDERKLEELIKEKYESNGRSVDLKKARGILTDVRSIVFVDRKRKGYRATKLYDSRCILATFNKALVYSAFAYDKHDPHRSDTISACVSADTLGTLLWLHSPTKLAEYKRLQLLADCYASTNPSQALMDRYEDCLEKLKDEKSIDEETFIMYRASDAVRRPIANAANAFGEFTEKTCLEVIKQLKEEAHYKEEARIREVFEKSELEKKRYQAEHEARYNQLKSETTEALLKHVEAETEYKQRATEMQQLIESMHHTNERMINAVSSFVAYLFAFPVLCVIVGFALCHIDVYANFGLHPWAKAVCTGVVALLSEVVLGVSGIIAKLLASTIKPIIKSIIDKF